MAASRIVKMTIDGDLRVKVILSYLPSSGLGEDGSSSLNTTGCLSQDVARNSLREESALMRKTSNIRGDWKM